MKLKIKQKNIQGDISDMSDLPSIKCGGVSVFVSLFYFVVFCFLFLNVPNKKYKKSAKPRRLNDRPRLKITTTSNNNNNKERHSQPARDKDRETETETQRERDTERHRDRDSEGDRDWLTNISTHGQRCYTAFSVGTCCCCGHLS